MPLAWMFAMVKPKVFVNGREMPAAGWGRTVVPAPPGQYHVHVHTPYFLPSRVGSADHAIVVQPGQGWSSSTRRRSGPSAPARSARRRRPTTGRRLIVISIVAVVVVFAVMLLPSAPVPS